jgi:hypothetical protein
VYSNLFPKFSDPEIVKVPLESIVLQLKVRNIDNNLVERSENIMVLIR